MAAKGVFELVEAAHICHQQGLNLRWRIFGENVRTVSGIRAKILTAMGLNGDVRTKLLDLIKKYGLEDVVTLEGFQTDYSKIYSETDVVLCITHANAAGRPVFEGAFFCCPSIVAMSSPTTDTVIPGVTAICIPANSPQHLADAAAVMESDRSLVKRMGNAAQTLANKNFKLDDCALQLNAIYDKVTKEVL
jgi:glycosyltransferase involved in cell wall biosynthesis